jgi:mono/diheme cytochrome c family protein
MLRRLISLAAALALLGCRGSTSTKPPIHLNENMDEQVRLDPQESSPFFKDGRGTRPPVEGTVAARATPLDPGFENGKVGEQWLTDLPAQVKLDKALLERGQQRYAIYCMPCHDAEGTGKGTVVERGMLPPPSFHDDRLRALAVGQLYDIVRHGIRNMPAYGPQVPPADRWAIAAYVRTLQRSRMATLAQVPPEVAKEKGWAP